jgi:hypothetical protein
LAALAGAFLVLGLAAAVTAGLAALCELAAALVAALGVSTVAIGCS